MKAFVFPGQASQFEGMGKDLYESSAEAKQIMDEADDILGFSLTKVMFEGTAEDLKATRITQPAVFVHSLATASKAGDLFQPQAVAGHSLGEFSALVASQALSFQDGLRLVQKRAEAMQKACEMQEGTMAAIIGLEDNIIEEICNNIDKLVIAANFNCPGQVVISGSVEGVQEAVEQLNEAGARRAIILAVGGAFHSPLMQPAKDELEAAINAVELKKPLCPIYQNVSAKAEIDPSVIKQNLIEQLTAPVRWTQAMQQMIADGVSEFVEVGGTGKVLQGFVKKIDRRFPTSAL